MGFDENKAMDLLVKKRHNKKIISKSKITSKYRRVNDDGKFRNNARNFQFDYEEDYYEPENFK